MKAEPLLKIYLKLMHKITSY